MQHNTKEVLPYNAHFAWQVPCLQYQCMCTTSCSILEWFIQIKGSTQLTIMLTHHQPDITHFPFWEDMLLDDNLAKHWLVTKRKEFLKIKKLAGPKVYTDLQKDIKLEDNLHFTCCAKTENFPLWREWCLV